MFPLEWSVRYDASPHCETLPDTTASALPLAPSTLTTSHPVLPILHVLCNSGVDEDLSHFHTSFQDS